LTLSRSHGELATNWPTTTTPEASDQIAMPRVLTVFHSPSNYRDK
jgi:hypothetical protein